MRNSISKTLVNLAEKDERIILLAGDIGFRIFDEYIEKYSKRFLNCGIAEQNMVSVSAGLASEGFIPVVYTIIPFLIMRAYEQIRVDIGINKQSVILIGVGGGLAYDKLGSTHHAYEDIALMRTIPNMSIYSPISPKNACTSLNNAYKNILNSVNAPAYIRLCKGGEPEIENLLKIEENIYSKTNINNKKWVLSSGAIASWVDSFSEELNNQNIDQIMVTELSFRSLERFVNKMINFDVKELIIIEEHFSSGGLYEAISGILFKKKYYLDLNSICLDFNYIFDIYDRETLLEKNGINSYLFKEWIYK